MKSDTLIISTLLLILDFVVAPFEKNNNQHNRTHNNNQSENSTYKINKSNQIKSNQQ
jgi:hypothetical protein